MEKSAEGHFTAHNRRPAFPKNTNIDYSFRPKPPKPVPPIDGHEFKTRFYSYHHGGTLHKYYIPFLPCLKKYQKISGPSGGLDRILKRKRFLNPDRYDREHFWGLNSSFKGLSSQGLYVSFADPVWSFLFLVALDLLIWTSQWSLKCLRSILDCVRSAISILVSIA